MKLSASNLASDESAFNDLLVNGYVPGIELARPLKKPLSGKIEVSGLQSLLYGLDVSIFNSDDWNLILDRLVEKIDYAYMKGCQVLVFGSPLQRRVPEDMDMYSAYKTFVQLLAQITPYLELNGVIIAIEPNAVQSGCNFINTYQQSVEFCKLLGSPNVRPMLDTATQIYNGEGILKGLELEMPCHVHLSVPGFIEGYRSYNTYFKKLSEWLNINEYNGWLTLEMLNVSDEDIVTAVNYARDTFYA